MSRLVVPVNARDHIDGSFDAPVVLVEYGDYECPYCGAAHPIVKRIKRNMGRDMAFVFRHFPLSEIHPHAAHAAHAAEAAGLQDHFWKMHDVLFENQTMLEDEDLMAMAQGLGLDMRKWIRDFTSDAVITKIEQDFSGGVRSGVNGTPTFFVNGLRHDGSFEYPVLLDAVQKHLVTHRQVEPKSRVRA